MYLPGEDLERFGVSLEEIASGRPSAGFQACSPSRSSEPRELFHDGAAADEVVTPDVRRGMRLARSVYLRILDRAERLHFDVLRHRAEGCRRGSWPALWRAR